MHNQRFFSCLSLFTFMMIILVTANNFLLLAVNLIFAPHNPYQEKDSVFERGFHSFLGQNRTQFISFFIFALLFLLFDLEILLVYPYIVSAYTNSTYGLVIMLIFFSVLTIGFVFELGKKALKIDSRQVFSLAKKQQTTAITAVSGFFFFPSGKGKMRDYLALFKGLIKLQYLKLALKKVFSPWPVFIMVMAFIVTVTIRLQLKKYDCDFLFFQSDILFYISSISTIFTGALIRKYFQLFNSIFESIDWSAVYYYFTCSKAERWKVLQDFIKSLEQFNNEKIKVNNSENSLKDNTSLNKDNTNNIVSKMDGDPSNSLTKASGSGNNNTTVTRASGSGNNNTTVTRASGSNNLTQTGLSQLENSQQERAANLVRGVNNNYQPLTAEALRAWEEQEIQAQALRRTVQDDTLEHIENRTLFSSHNRSLSSFSTTRTTSTYLGPLNNHFARIQNDCTAMWLRAIENISLDYNHIVIDLTNVNAVNQEYRNMLNLLIGLRQNLAPGNIANPVGSCVGDRVINGILRRFPYLFNEWNTYEPSVLNILLHLGTCFIEIHSQAFDFAFRFSHLDRYMCLAYNHASTLGLYRNANPVAYNHIKSLVMDFGDVELRNYFSNDDNPILYVYISLKNANKELIISAKKYEMLLREVESCLSQYTNLTKEDLAYRTDNLATQGHLPSISCGLEVKFSRIRI